MKLYRGLKNQEYKKFDAEFKKELDYSWAEILKLRGAGTFDYPEFLNSKILRLVKVHHFAR